MGYIKVRVSQLFLISSVSGLKGWEIHYVNKGPDKLKVQVCVCVHACSVVCMRVCILHSSNLGEYFAGGLDLHVPMLFWKNKKLTHFLRQKLLNNSATFKKNKL